MALYYPQSNQKRPLILVGPPSIGRHELRQSLLEDTTRFAAAVPRKFVHSFLHRSGLERVLLVLVMENFSKQEVRLTTGPLSKLDHFKLTTENFLVSIASISLASGPILSLTSLYAAVLHGLSWNLLKAN